MTARAAEVGRFYVDRSRWVAGAVANRVRTSDETVIEDACSFAWVKLLGRPDIELNDRGAEWIITVATRQGWRLARVDREVPSGAFRGETHDPFEASEPASLLGDPESRAIGHEVHARRVEAFGLLTPDERRVLYLQALGYSYAEIAAALCASRARVNGRLSEGRAKLARRERIWRRREARGV